jgi:voltage-dependent anion channel protein 2
MSKRPTCTSYEDLGKSARDLLSKPFFPGLLKFSLSTKNSDGVKFTVEGDQDCKDKAVKANLKAEYKDDPSGVSVTEKWDTAGKIDLEVGFQDHLAPGLKFTAKPSMTSDSKDLIGGDIVAEYAHELANAKVTVAPMKRTVDLAVTAGTSGFVGGLKASANLNTQARGPVDVRIAYIGEGYSAEATAAKDLTEFGCSYYQSVRPGVSVSGTFELKNSQTPLFTVGGEYKDPSGAKFNGKVDSTGKVGVAYSVALAAGVTGAVSTEIDTTKIDAAPKTGFKLTFEF